MPKAKRSDNWGFPRWGSYESSREAQQVKLCDRHGCNEAGPCPAPKSPNSPERWYFCEKHAAEYNRGWDYFEGLDKEERARREADEQRDANAYQEAKHYSWMGSGDGSRSRDEMTALEIFDLTPDVDFETVKKAWRAMAKEYHPDVNPGDAEASKKFQAAQAAFDVLKVAEERRVWKPA
ncbi:J domain-containing protein [Parasphingorhabdus sp.]|uniref:J domain-containing protein n=1 Tax=Parasphingorhabdus sp. TaxID=2709688 RepID=UPI002F94DED0